MFTMIGLGEKAGSGFQKILRAWREQSWAIPLVDEDLELELTKVILPTISLIPENVAYEIKSLVGEEYSALSEITRIALMLAHHVGNIRNTDIQRYCANHPADIGEELKYIVSRGWLKKRGQGRGTQYSFPALSETSSQHSELSSQHSELSSQRSELSSQRYGELQAIAKPVSSQKRVPKETMRHTILALCKDEYLSAKILAELLQRDTLTLSNHYLIPMVKAGLLEFQYLEQPNHPQQKYKLSLREIA